MALFLKLASCLASHGRLQAQAAHWPTLWPRFQLLQWRLASSGVTGQPQSILDRLVKTQAGTESYYRDLAKKAKTEGRLLSLSPLFSSS